MLQEELATRRAAEMTKVQAAMRRVQISLVSQERRQSEKERAALDVRVKEISTELESMRKSLDESTVMCAKEKKEREGLEVELKVKSKTIDKMKADICGVQGQAAEAESKLRSEFEGVENKLRAEMAKTEAELVDAKKKLEEAMLRAVSEAKERKRLETERAALEGRRRRGERAVRREQRAYARERAALQVPLLLRRAAVAQRG